MVRNIETQPRFSPNLFPSVHAVLPHLEIKALSSFQTNCEIMDEEETKTLRLKLETTPTMSRRASRRMSWMANDSGIAVLKLTIDLNNGTTVDGSGTSLKPTPTDEEIVFDKIHIQDDRN